MGTLDKSWAITEMEFAFNSQQEAMYPMLMRMHQDFDFKIMQRGAHYCLATREYLDTDSVDISPLMMSLDELEQFASNNMVDILYSYLFDIPNQEIKDVPLPQHCALS